VPDDDEIDQLLARGRLSGPQRERIFDRLYESVRPAGMGVRSRLLFIATPLAVAAAIVLVLRSSSVTAPSFTAKGHRASRVEVVCSGGPLSACPRGSHLFFRFDAGASPAFVQAYAEPINPNRERVWYFPTAATPAPRIESAADGGVLEKAIVLGPEHANGRYQVRIMLSATPMSREDVLLQSKNQDARAETFELEVVTP
jgi:hypothetical protein